MRQPQDLTPGGDFARRIALALHSAKSTEELAAGIQDTLLALGCGGTATVLFASPDGRALSPYLSAAPEVRVGESIPVDSGPCGRVLRDGTTFRADAAPPTETWGTARVSLHAAFPLVHQGERYGVLALHDPVPEAAMPALEVLAEQAALSLIRVQLVDEVLRAHAVDSAKLAAIAQTGDLLGNLELEVILVKVVELALSVVSAEVGSLLFVSEEKGLSTRVEWGLPETILSAVRFSDGTRVVDRVVETREPLLAADVGNDPRLSIQGVEARLTNLLVIPLATQSRSLGCLAIVNSEGASFTRKDQDVLMTIAGLASIAMENAMLHEAALERARFKEQLRVAGAIQKSLLPASPPVVSGLAIDGMSRPCDDSGGDYYDFFALPGGRLGFCVGDVTGHGIGPALLMTTARAFLRAYVGLIADLGELFVRLNQRLTADMGGDRFITLLFGILDPATGLLEYTSAGHDPAILYRRAEDRFEELDSTGIPLGMIEDTDFPPVRIAGIRPGDLLLSLTDGVTEAMNAANELLGRDPVLEIVRAHRDDPPAAILAAIDEKVKAHSGATPQRDDVTMVCLRVVEIAGESPAAS